ncbi:MAG: DUF11 domain-containing protein, partial [Actinobacteria bacterium]|nr:DUF11 domain-containing protein [Actinomycetota bacterium]
PQGTQMQGNQCVAPVTCPQGTQMEAGTCVAPATVAEQPKITISKTERDASVGGGFVSGPINVRVGDVIGYQIVVTNTGNDDLLVNLTDSGCQINASGQTISGKPFSDMHMSPGQALTFRCWHVMTNADAPVYTNTATANGVSASASGSVNGSASVNASSSTSASPLSTGPVSSSVVANAPKVLAAKHTVTKATPKKVAQPKVIVKVVHVVTKPAPKVVKAASFTG